ncbi:oligosaccharide flippase family protein [Mycolicibacterium boenickei]|nr:oligosaccharide flippase family protein [Mycolicibacterium boenickei]
MSAVEPHAARHRRVRVRRGAAPFLRNAYLLVLNTGITGVLGLVYWVLAARFYDDSDVGRGSAAISALMLLTGLVSVNFAGTLNRFIPKTGSRTTSVVAFVYLVTSVTIAVLAVALLLTLHLLGGPAYDLLREQSTRMWFIAAAVAASVVTVQDSVLTGLRMAVWVPIWNAVFAVAKIVLLVALAHSMPRHGLFFSWIIPMIVVMFPVNLLIFGRLLPQHARRSTHEVGLTAAQIGRFFAADYFGALVLYGTLFLVPVLVASVVAPHTYAYFFLAWAVATMMNLVAVNLAVSMAVEGVYDPSSLAGHCRTALTRALGLLVFGVVAIGLAAPYTLGLLGSGYLDAVPLLQLLALASLPSAVVDIYLGTLRARTRQMRIVAVQSLRAVAVLGLVVAALHSQQLFMHFGDPRLTAVGAAVLLGQLVVMLAVLPDLARLLRGRRRPVPSAAAYEETICLN